MPNSDTFPSIQLNCPRCSLPTTIPLAVKPKLLHYQYECTHCGTVLRVEKVRDNYLAMFVSYTNSCANGNCEE